MKASDAIEGHFYSLPENSYRGKVNRAECAGWNFTHKWLIFFYFDDKGQRKHTAVAENEEITHAL